MKHTVANLGEIWTRFAQLKLIPWCIHNADRMAFPASDLPPWDQRNKEQQTAVCHSKELHLKLVGGVPGAKVTLILDDVWAHLQVLGVVDLTEKNRISVSIQIQSNKMHSTKITLNIKNDCIFTVFRECILSCSKNENC